MRPRDKTVSWFTYPEIYMFIFYDSAKYQTCPSHIKKGFVIDSLLNMPEYTLKKTGFRIYLWS